jgi:hypothetical protein
MWSITELHTTGLLNYSARKAALSATIARGWAIAQHLGVASVGPRFVRRNVDRIQDFEQPSVLCRTDDGWLKPVRKAQHIADDLEHVLKMRVVPL